MRFVAFRLLAQLVILLRFPLNLGGNLSQLRRQPHDASDGAQAGAGIIEDRVDGDEKLILARRPVAH